MEFLSNLCRRSYPRALAYLLDLLLLEVLGDLTSYPVRSVISVSRVAGGLDVNFVGRSYRLVAGRSLPWRRVEGRAKQVKLGLLLFG